MLKHCRWYFKCFGNVIYMGVVGNFDKIQLVYEGSLRQHSVSDMRDDKSLFYHSKLIITPPINTMSMLCLCKW